MWRKSGGAALLATCSLIAALGSAEDKADHYPNYSALSSHEREGVDYRIELTDRGDPVTAMAIHGGRIEGGSDAAAKLVAGSDWNIYAFVAIKPDHNRVLHLTSTHFDEPRALALAKRSDRCVSMHGFALEGGKPVACIGGGNSTLAKAVYEALKAQAPAITLEYPCTRFGGSDAENILNRCVHRGVQIEMSPALREALGSDTGLAAKFKSAVRTGMGAKR